MISLKSYVGAEEKNICFTDEEMSQKLSQIILYGIVMCTSGVLIGYWYHKLYG